MADNSSVTRIQRISRHIEKKQKKIGALNGLAEFSIAAIIILSLCLLLSFISSNQIFLSLTKALAFAAILICLYRSLLSVAIRKPRISDLSDELDRISPRLGEDFVNAYLLGSNLAHGNAQEGISRDLIIAHIETVAGKMEASDLSRLFANRKPSRFWRPLSICLSAFVAIMLIAPSGYRSFLFSRDLIYNDNSHLIELADIKVTYEYPAYTQMPSKVASGTDGNVRAIKGTNVTIEATPLKPLSSGRLILEKGFTYAIERDNQNVRANFVIISDDTYHIEDQRNGTRSGDFLVSSVEDSSPEVSIENPLSGSDMTTDKDQLNIPYRASDDFGISKITLEWESSRGTGSKTIQDFHTARRSEDGNISWSPQEADAESDETIYVKLKAYDNDTVSGPKIGESNVIKVRLSNQNKKHEHVMSIAEKLQDQLLEILADEIDESRYPDDGVIRDNEVAKPSEKVATTGARDKMLNQQNSQRRITAKIKDALSSLDQGLDRMRTDEQSDYTYFIGLSNMKIRIDDLYYDRVQLLSLRSASDLTRLDNQITREINEFEDDILFLDSMLKGEKLRQSLGIGAKMQDEYYNLKNLLQNLNSNDNENTHREIEKRVEYLEDQLAMLAQKLGELTRDLQREFLNQDAFPSVDLNEKLRSMLNAALKGEVGKALQLLEEFNNRVQDMLASLEGGLRSYRTASLSEEIMKMNELISKLHNLEKEEEALRLRTEEHKQALIELAKNANLRDFVDKEREKIETLQKHLSEMKSKSSLLAPEDGILRNDRLFDRIIGQTEELSKWLEAFEFREALAVSEDIEQGISAIGELGKLGYRPVERLSKQAHKSKLLAKEIHSDIENLLKNAARQPETDQLAQRQQEIRQTSARLSDELRSSGNNQSLPQEIGDSLEEATGFMRSSQNNLNSNELSRAISNQEEAIKSLKKARSQSEGLLKDFMLSAKGEGKSVPMVLGKNQSPEAFTGFDTSYVEIPKPQQSDSERYFKEKILDALKQGSPEGYSDLNKRYYERIIK